MPEWAENPNRTAQCTSAAPAHAAVGVVASNITYIIGVWCSTR